MSAAVASHGSSTSLAAADGEDGRHATAVAVGIVTSVDIGRTVMLGS